MGDAMRAIEGTVVYVEVPLTVADVIRFVHPDHRHILLGSQPPAAPQSLSPPPPAPVAHPLVTALPTASVAADYSLPPAPPGWLDTRPWPPQAHYSETGVILAVTPADLGSSMGRGIGVSRGVKRPRSPLELSPQKSVPRISRLSLSKAPSSSSHLPMVAEEEGPSAELTRIAATEPEPAPQSDASELQPKDSSEAIRKVTVSHTAGGSVRLLEKCDLFCLR